MSGTDADEQPPETPEERSERLDQERRIAEIRRDARRAREVGRGEVDEFVRQLGFAELLDDDE